MISLICENNAYTIQKYTREIPHKNVFGVDIGTCAGASAIAMATAREDITVHTCDPLPNPEYKQNLLPHKNIVFYEEASAEFGPKMEFKPDIVFVDGIHDDKGVEADILNICSKMREGGFILFHDYNLYRNTIGKAVDDYEGKVYKKIAIEKGMIQENGSAADIYVARKI